MAITKQPTTEQLKATDKAYKLRERSKNDNILAKQLSLSKVTLYTRLKKSNWKNTEILFIEYLSNPTLFIEIQSLNIL